MDNLEISVVIPIYQNNDTLKELCSRIMESLKAFRYEVVFVNDNSSDNSFETLQLLSAKHYQIKHLFLDQNVGQQRATLEGLKIVSGSCIVVLDGDLQDKPELIPALYEKISSTKGAVFIKRNGTYQSLDRMLTSIFIKKVIQLTSGLHYKSGSFYMFHNKILSDVTKIATNCKHPYLSIIVAHFSGSINYITSVREKRIGNSQYTLFKRVKAAFMAIYCSAYCRYVNVSLG